MNTIGLKDWSWETGQKMEIRWAILAHDLRELGHDLWQTITIPGWMMAVHRRRDQKGGGWSGLTSLNHSLTKTHEDRFHTMGHEGVGGVVDGGHEVGDAGEQTDGSS